MTTQPFSDKSTMTPAPVSTPIPPSAGPVLGINADCMMELWNTAAIRPTKANEVAFSVNNVIANWPRYQVVSAQFGGMPPWFVGIIHGLEASFNFNTHLANGDPLFNSDGKAIPTTHVPAGLGPFATWEAGAIAAFHHEGWTASMEWDLGTILMRLRAYNGTGYEQFHGINTPYIWSMTNHYTAGRYVADGDWSSTSVSQEAGAAATMLGLKIHGVAI